MPPNIIDIILKAIGDWIGGLGVPEGGGGFSSTVDIVIRAVGEWLDPLVDIVVRATPSLGGLSPMMILAGGFLVLVMGWEMMHEKGG